MKKIVAIGLIMSGMLLMTVVVNVIKLTNYHNYLKQEVVTLQSDNDTLRQLNTGLYQEVMFIKNNMEVIATKVNSATNPKQMVEALNGYNRLYTICFVPVKPKIDNSKTAKPDSIKPVAKKGFSLFRKK